MNFDEKNRFQKYDHIIHTKYTKRTNFHAFRHILNAVQNIQCSAKYEFYFKNVCFVNLIDKFGDGIRAIIPI